ncbi:MAG: dTDP-4-dehydrorhamnose 3,5-epimerase [Nitrospinota bacterium]|nr:dTDP-4-dehydrorhamnose 3,5-epimerase [Nitrospinota bacterium]
MKVIQTRLPEVLIVEPAVYPDPRGLFFESWNRDRYEKAGIKCGWVQDNISISTKGVLRGLHFQNPDSQAKLVQAIEGEIFDVAVDIRKGSPGFGQWVGYNLSSENRRQLFIPRGFAHGFVVLSDRAVVSYKCDDLFVGSSGGHVLWSDPDIAIEWPMEGAPLLSEKDAAAPLLKDLPASVCPVYEGA